MDEMKLKFLKDCWRYDNVKYHAEHEVYEKLRAAKVNNIAKVEGGGDVVDAEGEPQVTAAHWYLRRGKIKHLALVHYRLLIRQLGTPLKEYTWSNKLCYYLFLVLLAHEGSFKAGILHRDISPNNIMIDEAPEAIGEEAFLIDWDLCRYLHELNNGPTQKKRSGTWAFISALLLKYPSKQHELSDDLEPFIHVLHWFCLQLHVHNLTPSYQLSDTLSSVYFEARPQAGYDKGGDTKLRNMQKENPFFQLKEGHVARGLIELVDDLALLCSEHYATVDIQALEASSAELLKQREEEEKPKQPLPTIDESAEAYANQKSIIARHAPRNTARKPRRSRALDRTTTGSSKASDDQKKNQDDHRLKDNKQGSGVKKIVSPFATHDDLIEAFRAVLADDDLWQFNPRKEKTADQFDLKVHQTIKVAPVVEINKTRTGSKRNSSTAMIVEVNSTPGPEEPPQKKASY
ncbi:hypothetical protein C8Q75DRAFT_587079 [Abortiporus biennis]|nr:hypothetical protein C8Q75DRAFT_587079 [Abortiporus biennis]